MAPEDTRLERDAESEPSAVKRPVEARAGLISGHVITVLIVGIVLAIGLMAVAWAIIGT